jgi:hypothetical protein
MTYSELKALGLDLTQLKQLKRNAQMLIEDAAVEECQSCVLDPKLPLIIVKLQVHGRYLKLTVKRLSWNKVVDV